MEMVYWFAGVLAYVLTGFLKSGESFDVFKALRTVVAGFVLFLLNMFFGVEIPAEELEAVFAAGQVALAENVAKTVWRKLVSPL